MFLVLKNNKNIVLIFFSKNNLVPKFFFLAKINLVPKKNTAIASYKQDEHESEQQFIYTL